MGNLPGDPECKPGFSGIHQGQFIHLLTHRNYSWDQTNRFPFKRPRSDTIPPRYRHRLIYPFCQVDYKTSHLPTDRADTQNPSATSPHTFVTNRLQKTNHSRNGGSRQRRKSAQAAAITCPATTRPDKSMWEWTSGRHNRRNTHPTGFEPRN